jgi:hypothetical protein
VSVAFPEIDGDAFAGVSDEPADLVAEFEAVPDEPAADLVEWTPERGAAIARGFGLALHTFDPAANLPGGDELWRATEQEAREIGAPLSRILARYSPTRRLAGVVDEAELGVAMVSYAKRNMRERGRVLSSAKDDGLYTSGGEE